MKRVLRKCLCNEIFDLVTRYNNIYSTCWHCYEKPWNIKKLLTVLLAERAVSTRDIVEYQYKTVWNRVEYMNIYIYSFTFHDIFLPCSLIYVFMCLIYLFIIYLLVSFFFIFVGHFIYLHFKWYLLSQFPLLNHPILPSSMAVFSHPPTNSFLSSKSYISLFWAIGPSRVKEPLLLLMPVKPRSS